MLVRFVRLDFCRKLQACFFDLTQEGRLLEVIQGSIRLYGPLRLDGRDQVGTLLYTVERDSQGFQ